jgi:hypothetical protein
MYNTIFRILYIIFPKMLEIAFQGLWITIFVLGSMPWQPRWTTLQLYSVFGAHTDWKNSEFL